MKIIGIALCKCKHSSWIRAKDWLIAAPFPFYELLLDTLNPLTIYKSRTKFTSRCYKNGANVTLEQAITSLLSQKSSCLQCPVLWILNIAKTLYHFIIYTLRCILWKFWLKILFIKTQLLWSRPILYSILFVVYGSFYSPRFLIE